MEEKRKKKEIGRKALYLGMLLGFTLALFLYGCAMGELAAGILKVSTDPAAWGGFFGLIGFFIGALALMRVENTPAD